MKLRTLPVLLLLAVPSVARAEIFGVRVGAEAPLYTYASKTAGGTTSYSISDTFQPAINVLVGFQILPFLNLGVEGREGISASNGGTRTGTFLGPSITFGSGGGGFFNRTALPIHLEPGGRYVTIRNATGLAVSISAVSIYAEGLFDYSFSGNYFALAAGNVQGLANASYTVALGAGAGLWLRF